MFKMLKTMHSGPRRAQATSQRHPPQLECVWGREAVGPEGRVWVAAQKGAGAGIQQALGASE